MEQNKIGRYGPGQVLWGEYQINQLIGIGGTSEIYRVIDQEGKFHAAKVIKPDLLTPASGDSFLNQFRKEAGIHTSLKHRYIVKCSKVFLQDTPPVGMLLEYIRGGNLAVVIQNALSNDYVPDDTYSMRLTHAISTALDYLHNQHIYHCDVKPGNILIDDRGIPYLADFSTSVHASDRFQVQPLIKGAPAYMAPEQFIGQPVDARTDVYALALTVYQLFSGGYHPLDNDVIMQQHPYDPAKHYAWFSNAHQNVKPLPPSYFNPQILPTVDHVFGRALAKEPAERYPAAREFYRDLGNALTKRSILAKLAQKLFRTGSKQTSIFAWDALYEEKSATSIPYESAVGVQHVYGQDGIQPAENHSSHTAYPHIFISYAHEDGSGLAKMIDQDLRQRFFNTWWDNGIEPGADWEAAIRSAIDQSDALVVIMTQAAQESRYVRSEWRYALDERRIPVIPVIAHGFDPARLPLVLREIQWIDARADYEQAMTALAAALQKISPMIPFPPPPPLVSPPQSGYTTAYYMPDHPTEPNPDAR